MGGSERTSVVDAASRVHGIPNLYVTGASVFPTSSYVNPTLTASHNAPAVSAPASAERFFTQQFGSQR